FFARAAAKKGLDMRKVVFAENKMVDDIFETIVGLVEKSSLVMGMGNIGGPGLELVQYFRNRSILE
ncbi:MAG: poly-gamma-glutamate synthase PgsB, partial [Planctomycetota bacterium]